jgi:hypothetical protein
MAMPSNRDRRPVPQDVRGGGLSTGAFLLATMLTVAFGVGVVLAGYFWMGRSGVSENVSEAVSSATRRADPVEAAPKPVDDGNWTDADIRNCKDKATEAGEVAKKRKLAAASADRVGLGGPDPGMVERSTYLLCGATTKPTHLCQSYWRKWYVTAIREHTAEFKKVSQEAYWTRHMVAERARAEGGASAAELQELSDDLDQTTREVAEMHDDIVASFRSLVADGIILPEHFAKFLGLGIPTEIGKMIGGVEPVRDSCG